MSLLDQEIIKIILTFKHLKIKEIQNIFLTNLTIKKMTKIIVNQFKKIWKHNKDFIKYQH